MPQDSTPPTRKMLPIWFWVGLMLFVVGLIITGTGIYYLSHPVPTVMGHTNPALWWGALMDVSGIIFLAIGLIAGSKR